MWYPVRGFFCWIELLAIQKNICNYRLNMFKKLHFSPFYQKFLHFLYTAALSCRISVQIIRIKCFWKLLTCKSCFVSFLLFLLKNKPLWATIWGTVITEIQTTILFYFALEQQFSSSFKNIELRFEIEYPVTKFSMGLFQVALKV